METLLNMSQIYIEGMSDEVWSPIIKGVDLTLARGEVLGLIGLVVWAPVGRALSTI